jgi:uncharacterized membrane protein YdjX (TVP38/TMEM64 family)
MNIGIFYDIAIGIWQFIVALMQVIGPAGFFLVMIIQAIAAPIPSELVLITGGASYGLVVGTIVGGLGEIAGAFVAFFISVKLGRPIVERLVGKDSLEFSDKWFHKYGGWAVLLGRLTPFIPFDAISYAAGLTKMSFRSFIIATAVGAFPRAAFYCFLGSIVPTERGGLEAMFTIAMIIVVAILLAVFVLQYYIKRKLLSSKEVQ